MQLQLRLSIFRLFHGVRIGSLFLFVLHGLPFSPHTAIKPWGGYLIFAIDFLNARFPLCNQILSSVRHLWIRRQAKAQGFVIFRLRRTLARPLEPLRPTSPNRIIMNGLGSCQWRLTCRWNSKLPSVRQRTGRPNTMRPERSWRAIPFLKPASIRRTSR